MMIHINIFGGMDAGNFLQQEKIICNPMAILRMFVKSLDKKSLPKTCLYPKQSILNYIYDSSLFDIDYDIE